MSDLIRRKDARLIALEYISDTLERHGALEAIRALPAVQPDAAALIRWHDMLLRDFGDDLSSIVRAEMLAMLDEPAVQPAHVNKTPKSEHDTANMLKPDQEVALREALAVVIDELRSGPCALEARRFLQSAVGVEILALIDKPAHD